MMNQYNRFDLNRDYTAPEPNRRNTLQGARPDCIEPSCLNCGPKGCQKCPNLIVYPSRKCVDACPFGYHESWSTKVDFMGLICVHNGNFLGLSSDTLTILTGVFAGLILCLVAFFAAFIYIKFKRKKCIESDTSSESDESTPEKKDFLKQLETLRPYSQCYLDMLNDTRHQIRQLHHEGDHSAIAAYKPVVRDLAKILFLLNRSVDTVSMPDDWEHILTWAEKALKRYKRMSDSSSQPQVAQLINFLQSPIIPSDVEEMEYSVRGSTTMSTFKPDQPYGSSLSLQTAAIKTFSTNYEKLSASNLNPEWKFEYSLVGTSSEFDPIAWKSSKEFISGSPLFLEDDFYQLGFRPQDEITTEL
ncbi:uncharacterized protein LOC126737853 isoform X3 [Anthonomus grandis grandis]|uniref:uncharacterized protein LOC126737853 isoform X3 n=1 Tax=Anthonomus grandis grandis TaxID=2921223 RepID=UPI0021664827|nr:uncharacterized protein LOC126737853 isoform X3 [Anthonomus grandis grandis]